MTQFACQTITWGRERLLGDYAGIVKEVAQIGYQGVESNLTALGKARAILGDLSAETGIQFIAAHCGVQDAQAALAEANLWQDLHSTLQAARVKFLLLSQVALEDVQEYRAVGRLLIDLQQRLGDLHVRVLYHNHQHEIDHRWQALRELCAVAGPDDLGLAVDFGWVMRGGVDPQELVDDLGPYIRYAHLKDFRNGDFTELGAGDIGLEKAIPAIRGLNLPWWIAEQDQTTIGPRESATANLAFLTAHRPPAAE